LLFQQIQGGLVSESRPNLPKQQIGGEAHPRNFLRAFTRSRRAQRNAACAADILSNEGQPPIALESPFAAPVVENRITPDSSTKNQRSPVRPGVIGAASSFQWKRSAMRMS
jgi:hypothetical protein